MDEIQRLKTQLGRARQTLHHIAQAVGLEGWNMLDHDPTLVYDAVMAKLDPKSKQAQAAKAKANEAARAEIGDMARAKRKELEDKAYGAVEKEA